MDEIWRSIKGYEGLYEVSSLGRVRSLDRYLNHWRGGKKIIKGQLIKPYIRRGYYAVNLWESQVCKHFQIHRLVAGAFLPNPENLPCVNHKDENKLNNRVDNLEWCTNEYNHNYGTINIRIAEARSIKVYMYTLDSKLCGLWKSVMDCGRNGFSISCISRCCNGKKQQYKGFKWSYNPPKPLLALPYFEALPRS